MATTRTGFPVSFIKPDGEFSLRMGVGTIAAIHTAAESLGASHFVMQDGFDARLGVPLWGVFATREVRKNTPVPREYCLGLPIKVFAADTADGAVMWALAMRGRI